MTYTSNTIGNSSDDVLLKLGNDALMIAESWNVHEGILEQPAAWSVRCGWGATAAEFLAKYPKGTPFQLYVGGALQQTGKIDGRLVRSSGGATEIVIKGRDNLAPVYDTYVDAVQTFTDTTYSDLVFRVLQILNLVTRPSQIQTTNQANRQVKAGKSRTIIQISPPLTVDEILADANGEDVTGTVQQQIQANVGERWLQFLRRYLDPAGLILWAAADGTYVLSAPNVQQQPLYNLVRRAVGSNLAGNAYDVEFDDDATHRHAYAVCWGRGGGRKSGRTLVHGYAATDLLDPPNLGYAFQALSFREVNCQNELQAQNYAQRKLAEENRNGYVLRYTVAGHTLPVAGGNGNAVLTPDTIVNVQDEELGLSGPFYLESLERMRSPETKTRIRLCRTQDIVLAAPGT